MSVTHVQSLYFIFYVGAIKDVNCFGSRKNYSSDKRTELMSGIDKLLDDLYYIKDLLCLGKSHLNTVVFHKLLGLLVVPIMIPLMQLGKSTVRDLHSPFTFLLRCSGLCHSYEEPGMLSVYAVLWDTGILCIIVSGLTHFSCCN